MMMMQSLEDMVQEAGSLTARRELALMVHESDTDPQEKEWAVGRFEKLSGSVALLGMYASKTAAGSQAYQNAAAVFQWMTSLKGARAQISQGAEDGAKAEARVSELERSSSESAELVAAKADAAQVAEEMLKSRQVFKETALEGADKLAALAIVLSVNVDHLFLSEGEASSLGRIAESAVGLDTFQRASSLAAEERSAAAQKTAAAKLGAHGDKIFTSAPTFAAFGNSLSTNPTFQRRLEDAVLDQNATVAQHMDGSSATFDDKKKSLQDRQLAILGQARSAVPYGELCTSVAEVQCATWDGASVRQHPEVEEQMMREPEQMFSARYVVGQGILRPEAMGRLSRSTGSFPLSANQILPAALMEVIKTSSTVLKDLSDGDPAKELLSSLRALEGSEMMKMAARMVASSTAHVDGAVRILLHDIQINQLAMEDVSFGTAEADWHRHDVKTRMLDLERLESELLGLVWEQSQIARFPIAKALDKFVRAVGAAHLSPMASLDEKRVGDQRKAVGFSKDLMDLVLEKCKEAKALAATKAAAAVHSRKQHQQQQQQRGTKRGAQQNWQQGRGHTAQHQKSQQQLQQQPQQQQPQQQQPTQHSQYFSLQPADSSTTGKGKGAQLDSGRAKGRGKGKGKGGKGKGGRGKGY